MIRTVLIGIAVIALGSAAYLYLSVDRKAEKPLPVGLEAVRYGRFVASVSAEGEIIARKKETIVSPITGVIHDVGIKTGSHVGGGATLAYVTLSPQDEAKAKQEYKFAKMDLDILKEKIQAAEQLLKAQAVSEQDFKALQIQMLKQQMTLKNLRDNLTSKPVTTSFAGILIAKQFEDGGYVSAGAALATVIDPRSIVVQVSVPQHLISDVKIGQSVEYTSNTFPGSLMGKVTELPVMADQSSNQPNGMPGISEPDFSVIATINASPEKFLIGSTVKADFILAVNQEALFVPEDAVLFRRGHPIVFVLSSGRALRRQVKLGPANDRYVEITSGLGRGDTVVTTGNIDVASGNKIKNMANEKSINPAKSGGGSFFIPQ